MKKLMKSFWGRIVVFFLVVVLFSLIYIPLFKDTKFGLDLRGGFEVLYKVKRSDGKAITTSDMSSTYDVLKRNVDSLGVSEPEITLEGKDRIRVKLAGVTDIASARKVLSSVANVSFRDINDNLLMDSSVISGAKLSYDNSGNPAVALQIKDKDKFLKVTTDVSKKSSGSNLLVIWYNFEQGVNAYSKNKGTCGSEGSDCLSAATVSQGFSSDVIISGNFTKEDAERLATSINAGSISTKLSEISSKNVNASYGNSVLFKTFIAGLIGMALVILFMTVIYKFSGFISGINLLIYMLLVLGIFWLIGGVLTLPGIAALILGIGMAVDSCVIVNERIKEELSSGKSLMEAYTEGNKMSFSSIFDANATTFIVAIVLFIFGESSVKGFATMLIITIFATMFVMVFINRLVLKAFVKTGKFDKKPNSFVKYLKKDGKPKEKHLINAINVIKPCFTLFTLFIVVGVILLLTRGLNLGIDFRSGSNAIIQADNISVSEVKKDFNKLGYKVNEISKSGKNEVTAMLNDELKEKQINKVNNYFKDKYDAKTEIDVVTNLVKQDLVKNAIYSVLFAIIAIIIYVSLRFKFSFAVSSVFALIHDVLFIVFMFALFKIEVNVIFIAAILTILGYSINNTIVVFDRVREKLKINKHNKMTKELLKDIINTSITETFARSVNTTLTTLIPVICLIFFGAKGILPFNIALVFGLFAGAYSSIILAGQMWYLIEAKNLKSDVKPVIKETKSIIKEDAKEKPEEKKQKQTFKKASKKTNTKKVNKNKKKKK